MIPAMVEHMVWIKFHDGIDAARIREHLDGLLSLRDRVPGVIELAVGDNFTDRADGFTHGLLVRLASRDALQHYLDHPDHLAVAGPLKRDAQLRAMDVEHDAQTTL